MEYLNIKKEEKKEEQIFQGMNFVITGSVEHFANRAQAKEFIESLGGKVTGSVTGKTNYLINNDTTSNSSKNKKAKELGIPVFGKLPVDPAYAEKADEGKFFEIDNPYLADGVEALKNL